MTISSSKGACVCVRMLRILRKRTPSSCPVRTGSHFFFLLRSFFFSSTNWIPSLLQLVILLDSIPSLLVVVLILFTILTQQFWIDKYSVVIQHPWVFVNLRVQFIEHDAIIGLFSLVISTYYVQRLFDRIQILVWCIRLRKNKWKQ